MESASARWLSVVAALAEQAAVLNTNTRYLYDSLHDYSERLLARLQTHASDVVQDFALLATASPLTFRDWTGSPAGGIYGVQHRQEDMPLAPQTRVPGLYLSGQAIVSPGALVALCAGFLTESCVS